MTMYRQSDMDSYLCNSLLIDDQQYCIYGDPAYVLRAYMQIAYNGAVLSDAQKEFNSRMSACRIAVEWAFKDIKKYFSHISVSRKMHISQTPAGLWFQVSSILWNFRACLYGSQSATFFNCQAPSLEEYVQSMPSE